MTSVGVPVMNVGVVGVLVRQQRVPVRMNVRLDAVPRKVEHMAHEPASGLIRSDDLPGKQGNHAGPPGYSPS